jgi:hypothetical protein
MIRNAAFYLYPTVEDAKKGRNVGGTGFFIGVPSKRHAKYGLAFIYAVTNWHVACQSSPVIRLNTQSGEADIIDLDVSNWFFDPRYDIAVLPCNINPDVHKTTVLSSSMLLDRDLVRRAQIGPGDDVFMVGRFMDHDGGKINQPALRFGNIAADPTPMVQDKLIRAKADAYCVDLHSRTGYSGSPVFVFRTLGSDLVDDPRERAVTWEEFKDGTRFFLILGIHFAQFPEMWEVTSTGQLRNEASSGPLLTDGQYIRGLSGMTCVLPAWYIKEVLDMPELRKKREQQEERREEMFRRDGYPSLSEDAKWNAAFVSDASEPESESADPANELHPKGQERFNALPNATARKRKPEAGT